MHDELDAREIQTACSDIRRDQDVDFARAQIRQCRVTRGLREITVKRRHFALTLSRIKLLRSWKTQH